MKHGIGILAAIALPLTVLTGVPVKAESGSIVECALAKSSEQFQANAYDAFVFVIEKSAPLDFDRAALLALMESCEGFSELGDESQFRAVFAYFGSIVKQRAEQRLQEKGVDTLALDEAVLPILEMITLEEFMDFDRVSPALKRKFNSQIDDFLAEAGIDQAQVEKPLLLYFVGLIASRNSQSGA